MIKNQKSRAEKINQALFEVSQAVNDTPNLLRLYKKIHQILGNIFDVTNFYIAHYDPRTNRIKFPYYLDSKDRHYVVDGSPGMENIIEYSANLSKGSMTARVINSGEPALITKKELLDFCKKEKCQPFGTIPKIWMGAPLKSEDQVLGAIAVQSYSDENEFTAADLAILSSICDQVSNAIKRSLYEKSLLDSESRYMILVENIKEIVYSTDATGAITYASSLAESLLGFPSENIMGQQTWYRFHSAENELPSQEKLFSDLIHPEDRMRVSIIVEDSLFNRSSFQIEYRIKKEQQKARWVLEKGRFHTTSDNKVKLDGIILDIHDRKRAELINQTLYNITDAVKSSIKLEELYKTIHESLGQIIDVKNFYIGIYDKSKDSVSFPFDIDEMGNDEYDQISEVSQSPSLTGEVIRTGKPMLVTKSEAIALIAKYGDNFIGDPAEQWLGTPLIVRDEVIGAMVTQSYTDPEMYDAKDVETFISVSDQVATAIDRKRYEEELLRKELELRTLYEIANAINTTFNRDELFRSIHKSLQRIVDAKNMGIALYNEEFDIIEYPYLVDENRGYNPVTITIQNASQSTSLAYEVINQGKPMMLSQDDIQQFIKTKKGEIIGYLSQSWLGLPLKGKEKVLGAIIFQNYDEPNRFKQKEIDLLESVSGQIAFAIERKQADADLASTQRELIEYAHKVGMADIANSTLHNVGNILNSVKTSTDQINMVNRSSDFESFKRANDLLREKMSILEVATSDKEMAEKIVDYYGRLETQFERERNNIHEQVERLNRKIGLMTDVITTQQSFTSASFMAGNYSLEEIVEDVLTMQAEMLYQHKISINKHFQRVPFIQVQRTKLVHIIINLLINAKDAMLETPSELRNLDITLKKVDEKVQLSVKDSGIGISEADFSKIFTHGFTTKQSGHGFGLHNCAIYLEDMSGQIWAESAGAGKGAVFYISLPIATQPYKGHPGVNQ